MTISPRIPPAWATMETMITQPALRRPPLLVAEGGASVREPAHSATAVELGVRLGATAVSLRVWRTADDELVLAPVASVRRGLRKVELGSLRAADLPQCLSLTAAANLLGAAVTLVVEVPDEATGDAVAAWATTQVGDAPSQSPPVWLSAHDVEPLARWGATPGVSGTVHRVRREELSGRLERHLSHLRDVRVTALGLPRASWSGGLVAMAHRFGREAWAGGAEHTRMAVELLAMGVDAVGGPHPDRLVDAAMALLHPEL